MKFKIGDKVTAFNNMSHFVSALEETGEVFHFRKNDITKTGKHYNQMPEILKQLKEIRK